MIGKTFGHYHIIEKIGHGGMGEVFLADDTLLHRKVALKFLPTDLQQNLSAHQRFLNEAKSAAALDHPYICHINEFGAAKSRNFISMEYVDGQTLGERLKEGPVPLKETLQIAGEVAEALEEAHKKGIVHRDLKPANIMLTRNGHAKVMDFGLAKQLITSGKTDLQETETALTQAGEILGTLEYMSPEQLQRRSVDARSDLFSFGIVLYELLTGVHPFKKASPFETVSAILSGDQPPLDCHEPKYSRELEEIVKKLLHKDPAQRYQSASDLRADLNQAASDRAEHRTRIRFLRPAWRLILFVFLFLGIVPVVWWVGGNYFRSPQSALAFQERDWIVISDVENLTGDPVFDHSLQAAITVGIQQSRFVNVFPPTRVSEVLQRMRKDSGTELKEALACELAVREGIKAVLACSISQVGGVYSLTARLVDPNKRTTVLSLSGNATGKDQVLPVLDSLVQTIRRKLGESLASIARQNVALFRATTASLEALKTYTEGVRLKGSNDQASLGLIKQAVEIDPDFALAHAELGMTYYIAGNREEGEKHFATALRLMDRLTLREKLWIQAIVEDWRGNRTQAVQSYTAYLAQYPDDGTGWYRLGWVYMAGLGQYAKGIQAFRKVLEINPSDVGSHINIATCYSGLGQDEKAVQSYEEAFALQPSAVTGMYVNSEYGFALVHVGQIQKAAEAFQKMIDSGSKGRGYRSMALLDIYQGKLSNGISNLKQAVLMDIAEEARTSEYRDRMFLASAYRLKGKNSEFRAEIANASRILSTTPLDPGFIKILAKIYARLGRTNDASQLLKSMIIQAKNLTALSAVNRSDASDQAAIHLIEGEIALARGKGEEALGLFELSRQLESRNASAIESSAFAFRKLRRLQEAAAKYQEIDATLTLGQESQEYYILAPYELGKIYQELGDMQRAREYYERFFDFWKNADSDIPALRDARARYTRLP
jgi:serine/threonine protein kinase/Tfp pilus assembly protein PilF